MIQIKEYITVIDDVIKNDMCIGCGVCANVCPERCFQMQLSKYKEYQPVFVNDKCTKCKICLIFCPHSTINLVKKLNDISEDPHEYKLKNSTSYIGWQKDATGRIKSASGGVVTMLAKSLLENETVSAVIHAQMVENNRSGIHYEACISTTHEEIESRRSSFYFAFTFDDIIKQIKNTDKSYLLIAVPCIISSIKKICSKHKDFKSIKLYTLALSCSHNVNGQYTDYVADSMKINKKDKYKINLRFKDDTMKDANNFITAIINENYIKKMNRFNSIFTETWRANYFTMNCCLYCMDFWGAEADISVKDAWGKWADEDPLNKSMVIVRNDFIKKKLENLETINLDILEYKTMLNSQNISVFYKQLEAKNKLLKKINAKENIKNSLFLYSFTSKLSKKLYKYLGFHISWVLMKIIIQGLKKYAKIFSRG